MAFSRFGLRFQDSQRPLVDHAETVARKHGVPVKEFVRLIYNESRFNPKAFNRRSRATGIAQINPITQKELKITAGLDPKNDLDAAARYLSQLTTRFGDFNKALAGWNMGPSALAKGRGLPDETRNQMSFVLEKDPIQIAGMFPQSAQQATSVSTPSTPGLMAQAAGTLGVMGVGASMGVGGPAPKATAAPGLTKAAGPPPNSATSAVVSDLFTSPTAKISIEAQMPPPQQPSALGNKPVMGATKTQADIASTDRIEAEPLDTPKQPLVPVGLPPLAAGIAGGLAAADPERFRQVTGPLVQRQFAQQELQNTLAMHINNSDRILQMAGRIVEDLADDDDPAMRTFARKIAGRMAVYEGMVNQLTEVGLDVATPQMLETLEETAQGFSDDINDVSEVQAKFSMLDEQIQGQLIKAAMSGGKGGAKIPAAVTTRLVQNLAGMNQAQEVLDLFHELGGPGSLLNVGGVAFTENQRKFRAALQGATAPIRNAIFGSALSESEKASALALIPEFGMNLDSTMIHGLEEVINMLGNNYDAAVDVVDAQGVDPMTVQRLRQLRREGTPAGVMKSSLPTTFAQLSPETRASFPDGGEVEEINHDTGEILIRTPDGARFAVIED